MIKKLAAVKALAEKGVGGEKETARRMYEELKEKYGISDAAVAAVKEPTAAEAKQEFSGIAFSMWVLLGNLHEEKMICEGCPDKGEAVNNCAECATGENIRDLERQYEELKARFESGGGE